MASTTGTQVTLMGGMCSEVLKGSTATFWEVLTIKLEQQ